MHERGLAEDQAGAREEALTSLAEARAIYAARGELRDLQVEVRDLDRTNRRLRRAIDALHHDPYAVEKIARENLDLVAPGEILYLFPAELSPGGVMEPDAGRARP